MFLQVDEINYIPIDKIDKIIHDTENDTYIIYVKVSVFSIKGKFVENVKRLLNKRIE